MVSTMNSLDGRIKANAAIVPAEPLGAVSVYVTNTTNVVLDVDGYFVPTGDPALAFYPLTPCRVLDTRKPTDRWAAPYLQAGTPRSFPVLSEHLRYSRQRAGLLDELHRGAYQGQPAGVPDGVADGTDAAWSPP